MIVAALTFIVSFPLGMLTMWQLFKVHARRVIAAELDRDRAVVGGMNRYIARTEVYIDALEELLLVHGVDAKTHKLRGARYTPDMISRMLVGLSLALALVGCGEPYVLGHDVAMADAGPTIPQDGAVVPDAWTPDDVGADAAPGDVDGGADEDASDRSDTNAPDAAVVVGCAPDLTEVDDSAATAAVLATITSDTDDTTIARTWHDVDGADWSTFRLERTSTRPPRVTASDTDTDAMVTVRARCASGLLGCYGVNASSSADTCEATRREIAFIDVVCADMLAPVVVWVGVERGSADCDHATRLLVEPMP